MMKHMLLFPQALNDNRWQLSGSDYDFSTAVTGDITLTAVWTALPADDMTRPA